MVREDRVIMSVKELRRVHVIRQTREKKLTQVQAGALLGLTPRHIRRLIKRVAQAGDPGLAHRGRGKPSNRRIPEPVKAKALRLYAQRYGDFGPTLATPCVRIDVVRVFQNLGARDERVQWKCVRNIHKHLKRPL
jgi:Homeodomain-like domain